MYVRGWVSSPDGRGTLDIIWSSLVTIFLCSWTCLCLNVPSRGSPYWKRMFQKFAMACLSLIGPEFIFQLSLCQWASARRSVKDFKTAGFDKWTMRHAFLADMGTFMLHTEDWVAFPLDAKQVHYLVLKEYIRYEDVHVDAEVLDEKDKVDGLARLITVAQVLWFLINVIARAVQHLAMSTLELVAISYIVCALGTYYFWFHKPMDVNRPIMLYPHATIRQILLEAGTQAAKPYRNTPMDFVGCDTYSWRKYFKFWMNILWKMHVRFATTKRPVDKIADDYFPTINTTPTLSILFSAQCCYAAVHLCGWNFYFPTHTERLLWHIATIVTLTAVFSYWAIDISIWYVLPRVNMHVAPTMQRLSSQPSDSSKESGVVFAKLMTIRDKLRNNSPDHDPDLTAPLRALLPVTFAAATYCIARGYIVLDSFCNLRAMPASAFDSVNWVAFLPHI